MIVYFKNKTALGTLIDIVGPIYSSFVSALAFDFFAFLSFMKSRWQKRHIYDFVLWQKNNYYGLKTTAGPLVT